MVRFEVLGPLEVSGVDGSVDVGSYKQRSLLALLLIHRNEVLPIDRILDGLWGEDASVDRKGALHVYVSNLRTALEPGRERRSEGTLLLTRGSGYVLVTRDAEVDVDEFDERVREGHALADRDPAAASITIGEALAQWRGLPYQDFTYERWAQAEIERLTEARLAAVETRIQADLDRGFAGELVGELGSLVREHPLRERFASQLMLALYRSGRQAEALRTYKVLSEQLRDELGITPSAEIRHLEERIVMADPELVVPGTGVAGAVIAPIRTLRGYELREEIGRRNGTVTYRAFQPSVGRQVAVKALGRETADDPEFVRRFDDDARRVSQLSSNHVVPVYDHWREPGAAYLVERLMLGGTLTERMGGTPMAREHVAAMVEAVGDALTAAHRVGIAHGDLRPSNIMYDSDGTAFVADFRVGTRAAVASEGGTLSVSDLIAGDQAAFAVCIAQSIAGRPGELPELLVGMDAELAVVLGRATGPPADRFPDIGRFTDAVLSELAERGGERALRHDVANPYKGLRSFEQADAADFFGREREVERLIARIADPSRSSRFVAVVGPSGSGKSSLVKAGLIPALHRGGVPGSASWFTVEMVPGRYPFEALEDALVGVAFNPPTSMLPTLLEEGGIARTIDRILPNDDSQLVLIVDQLEELFTHTDPATANSFLTNIAASVGDRESRLRIVCTLRADFYDRPLLHPAFGELLRKGTEVITPMSPGGLEQAITGPARRVGVQVDQALVAEVVADVVERPAALPLMQYALTEMFDVRRGNVIPTGAYREVGGVMGALVQRAEGIYATLDEESKAATRQVFLRLVTLGEGGEQDARRRALVTELTALGRWGESIQTVLDTFGHHRLLTFDRDLVTRGPTVEISHEALLTDWTRLRRWIEDARTDVKVQRRLAAALREWAEADHADDYLLAGGVLQQMEVWAANVSIQLTDEEQAFLEQSIASRDRLEAETAAAEDERLVAVRRSRRRAQMLGALGAIAIAIAGLAAYAWQQRNQAHEQAAIAQRYAAEAELLAAEVDQRAYASRLADQTLRIAEADPTLGMLLALTAADASTGFDALPVDVEDAMHMAFQTRGLAYPAGVATVQTALTPDGQRGYYVMDSSVLASFLVGDLDRTLTSEECDTYALRSCPASLAEVVDPASLPPVTPRPPGTLEGTSVSIAHTHQGAVSADLEVFSERTGIRVDELEFTALGPTITPDVAVSPHPGITKAKDEEIGMIDLTTYLGHDLSDVYGEYLLDLVSDGDRLLGIPIDLDLKGLVWYPVERFDAAGLTPPGSWDALIELSEKIVDLGGAPWCTGISNDGEGDGWPATDWIEDLVIKYAGVETYDAWVAHEIPFDDPAIVNAFERFDEVLSGEGFQQYGRSAVSSTPWYSGLFRMFPESGTACWMWHGADFNVDEASTGALAFYELPAPGRADAGRLGGASFASAPVDRPEVRELMRFLASSEFGTEWAKTWDFLSPNPAFDPAHYGPEGDPVADTKRAFAELALDAIGRDAWRFDGSDMMPPDIGSYSADDSEGAFWTTMVVFGRGDLTPQQAATRIEEAWLALEVRSESQP